VLFGIRRNLKCNGLAFCGGKICSLSGMMKAERFDDVKGGKVE
jgi:hypothetical protein